MSEKAARPRRLPGVKTPDAGERPFIDAIAANPADDTVRLVMADWLEERGLPGDRLRAEHARALVRLRALQRNIARRDVRGRFGSNRRIYYTPGHADVDALIAAYHEYRAVGDKVLSLTRRVKTLHYLNSDIRGASGFPVEGVLAPFDVWVRAALLLPFDCREVRLTSAPYFVPPGTDPLWKLKREWPGVLTWGLHY